MKTRITIDGKTMTVMAQPNGYTDMSQAFVNQYNAACHISNELLPVYNEEVEPEEVGQENYERGYCELFLKCLNSVPFPMGLYKFTYYDGEDFEYEFRPIKITLRH